MDTQDKNIGTISRVLFFVCFLFFSFATFGNPLFNGHNDFSSTQQSYGATKKIKQNNLENISDNSSICESTISCVAPDCKELVDFKTKVPLLDICNSKEEISSLFVEQLYSDSFYLFCSQYVTKRSNTIIDFSIYSRYEISDWLYNIGRISLTEKLDLYYSFFLNRLFENETCLTDRFYTLNNEASNVNRLYDYPFQARSNMQIYSTNHFDINYDSSDVSYSVVPEIGSRFEAIRSFFLSCGYLLPSNETGFNRYQIYLYSNSGPNGAAAMAVFNGLPLPNTTSHIDMYYVSNEELDSKFNEVAAHEWYHALRSEYYSGVSWFDESFANWAGIIFDGDSEFGNQAIVDFINADVPLDNTSYNYGACLFPLTLYKDFGNHNVIKSFLNNYGQVISLYNTDNERFVAAINLAIAANGYTKTFNDVLRNMHSYNYLPYGWYNDVCAISSTQCWHNNDRTTYNLIILDGYPETAIEETKTYTNINVNRLGRKYFRLLPADGRSYNVEYEISFNGGNGFAQYHLYKPDGSIYIGWLNNVNNETSWHCYGLGSHYEDAGIILSNTSLSNNCTCNLTIRYKAIKENISFGLDTRMIQRRFFLDAGDCAEYTIAFSNSGRKIFQTLGQVDTMIRLFSSDGVLLNDPYQDDDRGYGTNSFVSYDCSSNQTVIVRISFYNANISGFTKLIVLNGGSETMSQNGIQQLTDIVEISHNNFYYFTWANQYKCHMLLYRPTISGMVSISLSSIFDNHLYVMDPTSDSLNINGVDYDDDSGSGFNALITRYLLSTHIYLIVYMQHNPSTSFTNLDEGDDLVVHFERISS